MEKEVKVRGPIVVTEKSHPFSAMRFTRAGLEVSDYGYLEEEYFVEGVANVYDLDEIGFLKVIQSEVPYCTRILVRRPKHQKQGATRVFFDIMNATNGYDIEDLWRRSWQYIMENNYSYVGITSKPINVLGLKYFDYERYADLNWSNNRNEALRFPIVPDEMQRIEGCEEGLVWDMLTQVGRWIKNDGKELFTKKDNLYLYLTGQSQSGVYLNTYVNQFHGEIQKKYPSLFDGYLSLVSGGLQRSLHQTDGGNFLGIKELPEREIDIPFISINSEGDFYLFSEVSGQPMKTGKNSTSDRDKRRYYEFAGAPHTNAASPLIPTNDEILKCKCKRRLLDGEYEYVLNDLPLEYYINGLLEKLHKWRTQAIAPPIFANMDRNEDGSLRRDSYGNVTGGYRSVFLEVPKASYKGSAGVGETNGTMVFFEKKQMDEIYGSHSNYMIRFKEQALKELEAGDIIQSDFERMLAWANQEKTQK